LNELVVAAWPTAALVLAWLFRGPLTELAGRATEIAGWKFQSAALTNSLPTPPVAPKPVEVPSAESVSVPAAPKSPTYTVETGPGNFTIRRSDASLSLNDIFNSLNSDAEDFVPELAIMGLSVQVEKQMRRLAAAVGVYPRGRVASFQSLLDNLAPVLPKEVVEKARAFHTVKNATGHGRRVPLETQREAVEAGRQLVDYFAARPEKPPIVVASGLEPYADAAGTKEQPGFRVMILQTSDGVQHAVPTRGSRYAPGREVSWEWSTDAKFENDTFFRDPKSNEVKLAWRSAVEFAGRPIDEL
jgi:hypothetical protein